MALKENINAIKDGISTEEQFLEGMIKGERFFKKHKNSIIAFVVVLVLAGAGYAGYDVYTKKQQVASNIIYDKLLLNPNDSALLEELKKSSTRLYETYQAKIALSSLEDDKLQELLNSNADPLLKELASYELNGTTTDMASGLVALQKGYELLQENKIQEAKMQFALISEESPLYNVSKNLEHYQGK